MQKFCSFGVDFLIVNVYTVSMTGERINFNNFVRLYEESTSIKCLKPLKNQTYKVLMSAKVDIRVIDRNDLFKFLKSPKNPNKYGIFLVLSLNGL